MSETDPSRDLNAAPVNSLPGVVWLVLLTVAGAEAVLLAAGWGWLGGPGGVGWRLEAIQTWGFAAELQGWMIETHRAPARHLLRYVTYSWVQPGPLAALFGLAMLAGLGKAVAEGLGRRVFLAVVVLVPPLAAAVFGLVALGDPRAWLFGAFPMAFGLVGAFTWMLRERARGDRRAQRRAFALMGTLMLARLGFGLLAEVGPGWSADLTAFALGYGLAAALVPGALARARRRG